MQFFSQKFLTYFTIFAIPLYLVKFSILRIPTNLFELFLLLNICLWIFQAFKEKNYSFSLSLPWQLSTSIGLLMFGLLISIFFNNAWLVGFGIFKSWFLLPLIFVYLLRTKLNNLAELEKLLLSFYCSTFCVAVIGFVYKLAGFATYDGRLQAFYASPNYLAMYLAPAILIGLYFFIKQFQESNPLGEKIFLGLSYGCLLLVIFWTYSYATWFSLVLAVLLVTFFYVPKKYFFNTVLTLASLSCLAIFSQLNSQKLVSLVNFSERSSLASRLVIWQVSGKLISENPLLGIGPGNFQANYLSLQPLFPPYLEWAVPQPHNIFLAFWLQTGFFGFLGFIFLVSFLLTNLAKTKRPIAGLCFAFFVYFCLHGLLDTLFWKNDLAFIFWFFLALASFNLRKKANL